MNSFFIKIFVGICFISGASLASAQQGVLRGGSVVLKDPNSERTVSLKAPSSGLSTYTLSLDTNVNSADSLRWLKNNGSGALSWDAAPGGLTGNA